MVSEFNHSYWILWFRTQKKFLVCYVVATLFDLPNQKRIIIVGIKLHYCESVYLEVMAKERLGI